MPRIDDIQFRRNTAAGAAASNPVLDAGEPGFETDTGNVKVGDGATAWNALPYLYSMANTLVAGDVPYGSAAKTLSRLAGNTAATNLFLRSAGTGSVAQAPAWAQPAFADLAGTAAAAQLPTLTAPGGGGSMAAVVYSNSFAGQTADIGSTSVTNSGTAGIYRISYYLQDTATAIGAGAVTLNVAYTDSGGSKTQSSAPAVLTSLNGMAAGSMIVQTASGNVTFNTSHTGIFSTAQYRLDIAVERLV
jgi:hypothetical protein